MQLRTCSGEDRSTGHIADNLLVVEKKAVAPGAKSSFHLLGPLD